MFKKKFWFLPFKPLFWIKFYQVFLSAHFGGACRFHPSCSRYAEKMFLSYPIGQALILSLKRLGSCHFFGPSIYREWEDGSKPQS